MDVGLSNLEPRSSIYDVEEIRSHFPIFTSEVNGYPLAFLDSGASAQKPECVLQSMDDLYRKSYANVHRGAYTLSQTATELYEGARKTVANYLNAETEDEIVFTRNVTASINLVAHSYGKKFLQPGDEVVISQMEHHANIVPWQMLRDEIGIELKIAPIDLSGNFLLKKRDWSRLPMCQMF